MAHIREEEKQKLLNVTGEQIEEIVGKKAEIEKNTADIAELKENGMGDTALREEVEALDLKFQTEIGKVNGLAVKNQSDIVALWAWNEEIEADVADRYTKEETDSAITAKVSEIVAGAPEDFDTLKEMSDWLTEHSDTAATMNSAILANANAITNLDNSKASKADVYTKEEVDIKTDEIASSLETAFNTLYPENKNILKNTAISETINGVTFTVNDDKSVTCNGTATEHAFFTLGGDFSAEGDVILSGCPEGGSASKYSLQLYIYNTDTQQAVDIKGNDYGETKSTTLASGQYLGKIVIRANQTVENLTFHPMLRYSDTSDTYEPYKPTLVEQIETLTKRINQLNKG